MCNVLIIEVMYIRYLCDPHNLRVYIVIVIIIFIWWSPFIPSSNLDVVFTYNPIMSLRSSGAAIGGVGGGGGFGPPQ